MSATAPTRPQYDVNLFDPAVIADPWAIYEEIRAKGRVVWNDMLNGWMVPGYDDVVDVLTKSGSRFTQMNTAELTPWFEGPNMISVDGEEHARLRKVLAPQFTRQAVAKWEHQVRSVVDDLLTPLLDKGTFDIVSDFTLIPTVIVAQMMGVPQERYSDLRHWSHTIVSNLSYGNEDPEIKEMIRRTGKDTNAYLADEMARHEAGTFHDLISLMMNESEMTPEEIRSTGMLLVLAGYDTTAKYLANALVVLEQHPDQRQAIIDDLSLLPAALEEVLRWEGVTHVILRSVLTDTEIGGVQMKAGDVVYVLKAAANRDPARFEDPARFDIRRPLKANVGFGFGPHLCIGAPLARLEAKVALEKMLLRAPNYTLHDIDYGTGMIVRGPERGYIQTNA